MSDVDDEVDDDVDDDVDDELDEDAYDDDDEGFDDGNRLVGGVPRNVLDYLARSIVDEPDAVIVETREGRGSSVELELHVAPGDMGRVIGRRGRVVQAIRTVVRAAAARDGVDARVDVVD